MTTINRRRFISIAAAAVALPRAGAAGSVATWRGIALGAGAQMQIAGLSQAGAEPLFARIEAEIDRLENIFSLYRPASALSRLNANGNLHEPPAELLEVLSLSDALHAATGGAFDPSIQPLWQAYARGAGDDELAAARDLVGWRDVAFTAGQVEFAKRGMALTLNGIAQGFVADRVVGFLRREGLGNVLVDMGEINALGQRPDGGPWRAGIVAPGQAEPLARVELSDRALATSAPSGTRIGEDGPGHIIDPRNGRPGGNWTVVSVSAERAAQADGLSTAFCLMDESAISSALQVFSAARLEYLS